jgi:hypothetical protein
MRIVLDCKHDDILIETPLGFVHVIVRQGSKLDRPQRNYIQIWPKEGVADLEGDPENILIEKEA